MTATAPSASGAVAARPVSWSGVLLGGVLTRSLGWEAVFFVNVPLAGAALIGAFVLIEADQARDADHRFDLPGALTATGGITLRVRAHGQAGPDSSGSVVGTAASWPPSGRW